LCPEGFCTTEHVSVTLIRKVLKEKVFSDGTHLPVGAFAVTPVVPHHMDSQNYSNPTELDPTRFEQAEDTESTRKCFTTVDPQYLIFGIGPSGMYEG
jgi:cytochrome P450